MIIAFDGTASSGKSTIANILVRLLDYDQGSVKLNGVELKEIKKHHVRENVGIILQDPFLYAKTIYENTASAPKNVTAVPADNNELSATISWTNPLYSINGSNLTEIEKMVVERSGEVICEVSGVKPGEQMSFVDNKVPGFNYYNYSVYAVNNGAHGKVAKAENVGFGPTCKWQLILQSSAFQGMRGASVTVYNESNAVVTTKTTTNSTVTTYDLDMPLGKVKFAWNPADESQPTFNLTMIVKDYNGNTLFDAISCVYGFETTQNPISLS